MYALYDCGRVATIENHADVWIRSKAVQPNAVPGKCRILEANPSMKLGCKIWKLGKIMSNVKWTVHANVLEVAARWNNAITVVDLDRAIAGKIKAELANLKFAEKVGTSSKLSIGTDFSVNYANKMVSASTAEFKPFAALLRFSDKFSTLRAEFKGFECGKLPETDEFKTLQLWIESLKPRKETKETENKEEQKPEEQKA